VFPYSKFWAIGSGRDFAIGAMYAQYDKLDSAEEIARVGVEAGCEFDTNSALPLTSYTIKLAA
jgi:ATP-dependent protease HslVU (ClpYQ) peptidase subunit